MLNTIEEAIEAVKTGEIIIIVDDEGRENEGDFFTAAQNASPETVNFMVMHGRGLLCVPMTEARAKKLDLHLMVERNTSSHETNFTVSVDLLGYGTTTGVSAQDRSKTVMALASSNFKPIDFGRPGHMFPLVSKEGGVLIRPGHTEAAVDICHLSGLEPVGLICEILNEKGEMARFPELKLIAERFNLKIISVKDLIAFRQMLNSLN